MPEIVKENGILANDHITIKMANIAKALIDQAV